MIMLYLDSREIKTLFIQYLQFCKNVDGSCIFSSGSFCGVWLLSQCLARAFVPHFSNLLRFELTFGFYSR